MRTQFLRTAITLGLLSAIGPFAIDMYLPALPSIGHSLHAGGGAVQLTLTAFFVAVSLGQPVCGPLSDMLGRKPPLYAGLTLFAVGSVGCALAANIGTLIAFRFLQGLGACAGMVIPRAVVRDLHSGVEAARLMALLMLVFSVSPILAPLTGSFAIQLGSWRAVFWAVFVAALLGFAILGTLAETRPPAARTRSSLRAALGGYRQLLCDRHFLGVTCIGAFGVGSFFVYLANSPFVMIGHYQVSPRLYSLLFATNAAAFIGTAQLTARLGARLGLRTLVRRAASAFALTMLALAACFGVGLERLELLVALLFVGFGCLGLVLPACAVLALEEHPAIAGTASALMGTLQFALGAAVMLVVGTLARGTPLPMVSGIAGCALIAYAFARITLRLPQQARAPVET
jgi:MFS transporter, DHA1 family, multidrug resistance protein